MNTKLIKTGFLFALCLTVFWGFTAKKTEYTKEISRSFNVNNDTWVKAANKYGDIHIQTWDKNEVSYKILVKATAKSESDAQRQLDRVSVDFSNDAHYVKAETVLGEAKKEKRWSLFDWNTWSWNDGNSWNSNKLEINYVINMPIANAVDISNKYGHINFEHLDGEAQFEVKYGNIKGDYLGKSLDLYVGYGDAEIKTVGAYANVEVSYGKFHSEQVGDMEIESKYSSVIVDMAGDVEVESKYDDYKLGQIKSLESDGKYDDFTIERVGNLQVESNYSDYIIGHMQGKGEFDMTYGDTRVRNLTGDFVSLEIEGSYHDFSFDMDDQVSFTIEAEGSYADMDLPSGNITFEKRGSSTQAHGYVGNPSCGNHIDADLSYGSLVIK